MAAESNALAGLCRLTVRAPDRSFDLAVPTDIAVADLLPTVVGYAGADLDDSGQRHGGWILQRLGEDRLAAEGTAGSLGLHDGEIVYLRPYRDTMPAVHYDDLVSGVMSGLSDRADSWRPEATRRLLIGLLLAVLAGGAALLLVPGPPLHRAVVALAVALLLMAGAFSASRAVGDAPVAAVLAAAGCGYLAVAGVAALPGPGDLYVHSRLLAAGLAVTAGAAMGIAAIGGWAPLFVGIATVGLLSGLAGVMSTAPLDHTAALVALVVVLLGGLTPGWGFWLSGLRLPPLPSNADQLQEGIDPHPSGLVRRRATVADGYITGLLVALGSVYTVCLAELALTAHGWAATALTAVLSVLAVLHGRPFGGLWHRLSTVLPGLAGLGLLAAHRVLLLNPVDRLLIIPSALVLAAALAVAAWTVPGRHMVPHWARAGELAHSAAAIAAIPLVLQVLGFFHYLRGLGG